MGGVDNDKPNNRLNDGKCDSMGRLWAGTMGPETRPAQLEPNMGGLFRIGAGSANGELQVQKMLSDVSISNGLCWSKDDTLMYYIDTLSLGVDVFDFDVVAGDITNRRRLFRFDENDVEGFPDGMTIDDNGHLWVACFAGSQVIEIDPGTNEEDSGKIVSSIKFGAKSITSVAFGGPDLRDLYVTSAMWGDENGPEAGSLYRVKGVGQGLPSKNFKLS